MQPRRRKWWHSCKAKPQTISIAVFGSKHELASNLPNNLIDELESILASKDISRRAGILRKVTDLFVLGSGKLSEDQIELFDNV